MNILPKKRWHVRTKQNIERVRRDEAEAFAKEQQNKRRIQLAEQETRIRQLRKRKSVDNEKSADDALGILGSLESSISATVNKEHEDEKKAEKEQFEKNIGLLTYLGQSSNEKPWYLEPRKSQGHDNVKEPKKSSILLDPLVDMKKYLSLKEKQLKCKTKDFQVRNHGKAKQSKSSEPKQGKTIEQLRAMRKERERKERERTRQLLEKQFAV